MLEIILLNSLLCLGVFYATKQGFVLEPIAEWYDRWANRFTLLAFLRAPLFGCAPCTASIWGIVGILVWQPFPIFDWRTVAYIFALMVLNILINSVIMLLANLIEKTQPERF